MVIEGGEKAGGIFQPRTFRNVFACGTTTRRAMGKRRPQQDSAHHMGPEIPIHRILMVVVSCCTGGEEVWAEFSPSEIGDVFTCSSTTSTAMVKWMAQVDSAHQSGLKPTIHAVLIRGC